MWGLPKGWGVHWIAASQELERESQACARPYIPTQGWPAKVTDLRLAMLFPRLQEYFRMTLMQVKLLGWNCDLFSKPHSTVYSEFGIYLTRDLSTVFEGKKPKKNSFFCTKLNFVQIFIEHLQCTKLSSSCELPLTALLPQGRQEMLQSV